MPFEIKDTISGRSLEAIRAAYPEFAKTKLDIKKYKVVVSEFGGEVHVSFWDVDRPSDADKLLTYVSPVVEFDVALDPSTLTILRAGLSK